MSTTRGSSGRIDEVTLAGFRGKRRLQELTFDLARSLTRDSLEQGRCEVPAHVMFPQLVAIGTRYVAEKVQVHRPADLKDLFLAPDYGWVIERLLEAIQPDSSSIEAPELRFPSMNPTAVPDRRPTSPSRPVGTSAKSSTATSTTSSPTRSDGRRAR